MQNQKEISQNSKSFSIIPMIKDREDSKVSQNKSNNKISNLQKNSKEEAKNQQFNKENADSPSPKKYNFNSFPKQSKLDSKNQQNLDSITNLKEDRKQLLRKIIFAAKSSYNFQNQINNDNEQKSTNESKNEKINKYNSDFPAQNNDKKDIPYQTVKSSNINNGMPKSISESTISEKDAQNNPRRIVFMIKTSSHLPPKPIAIKEDDKEQNGQMFNEVEPNLKRTSSGFPKKFNFNQFTNKKELNSPEKESENTKKVTRKSIQTAKSSNNLQKQFLIEEKPKQKETETMAIKKSDRIIKSNSDFPSPKNCKIDNSQKETKNESKSKEDPNLVTKIANNNSKTIRKTASTAKSANIIQNDQNLKPIPSQSKVDKIKKFNSDFPNQKKLETDDSPKDEAKINKENIKKISRKPIVAAKSSNSLQNQKEEITSAIIPRPSEPKTDKIKKSNSVFPNQKKHETDVKPSKESDSNKIPRKIVTATKSSNYIQDQKEESKIKADPQQTGVKTDKIKKSNSAFPTQRNLEIEDSPIVEKKQIKESNKENSAKKVPRKPITATKSSNALRDQNLKSADAKAEKIKKSNSSLPSQDKVGNKDLPKETINSNKKLPIPNEKSNLSIKEIEIEIEIENECKPAENLSTTAKMATKPKNAIIDKSGQIQNESEITNQQLILESKIKTREVDTTNNNDQKNEINNQSNILPNQNETNQNNTVSEFTPHKNQNKAKTENSSRNNSPNHQAISSPNTKPKNARKQNNKSKHQEPNLNSPETNNINQQQQNSNKVNNHKIKNIQIEYKNEKNKQEQKQIETCNNQKKPPALISIQKNQNQKQKLNIQMRQKENSKQNETEKVKANPQQQNETEKVKNNSLQQQIETEKVKANPQQQNETEKVKANPQQQTRETEKVKNNSIQQQKETEKTKTKNSSQHPKEHNQHKQSTRQKENRFVWKDTSSPTAKESPSSSSPKSEKENEKSANPKTAAANEAESAPKEKPQQQTASSISPSDSPLTQKEAIPLSESSRLSEETKKQIKYEIEKAQQLMSQTSNGSINSIKQKNVFTFKVNIESQPVCIAVGDIEGDFEKLLQIYHFIKANPSLHFVFIGDIIDDLSDACPTSKQSWDCLSLLSEFFIPCTNFLLDSNEDQKSDTQNNTSVSLPSSFCDVSFKEIKYGNIRSRVKFLAGNAECDNLLDFQKPGEIMTGEVTNYIFGKDKWKKTVTFDQMCLLYRYLKSCYGIIKMKKSAPEGKKNSNDFTDTVYFRHSPSSFKINRFPKNMYSPNPDLKKSDVDKRNFFFITGHCRIFASILSQVHENKELFYVVDTTVLDAQNQYLKDVGGFGANDRRLAVVSFDKEVGFSVKAFSLPFQFPRSTLKCTVTDKYVQIKGI